MTSPSPSPGPPRAASREIERLLDELARRLDEGVTREVFFAELLDRALAATGALSGIVWTDTEDGRFQPEFHRHAELLRLADDRGVQSLHEQVLAQLAAKPETIWIAPGLGQSNARGGVRNADQLLSFTPLQADGRLRGVLELGHAPYDDPAWRRGVTGLLEAFAALTSEFEQRNEWRAALDREKFWRQCEQFTARIHAGLDPRITAIEVANEGRRLLAADRLTVVDWRHEKACVAAVSGLERIERRSPAVRQLEQLVAAVLRTGEPLWYGLGRTMEFPPQWGGPLDRYLEQAPVRFLVIYPLFAATFEAPGSRGAALGPAAGEATGALVVEKFTGDPPVEWPSRLPVLARHAATAWGNSTEYGTLPFVGLLRLARDMTWIGSLSRWPWLARLAALAMLCVAAACVIPAEHTIEVRGTLEPREVRDVFAPVDGEVVEVHVRHEQAVELGAPLATLRSPPLELEYRRIAGERDATREKLLAIESARLIGGSDRSDREGERAASALSGSAEELRRQLESQEAQLAILAEQRAALELASPAAGTVMTWNVDDLLKGRPVQRGQVLVSLAQVAGPWELRLEVPDRRAGHVLEARRTLRPNLRVTYALAALPGRVYSAELREVWLVTEPSSQAGTPIVRMSADLQTPAVEAPRPGATVIAKIRCGRCSLAYAWFHGAWEVIQRELFF